MRRLTIALLLFAACARTEAPVEQKVAPPATPPPTVAEAKELIGGSAELGEFEFTNAGISIPVSGPRSAPVEQNVKELVSAGWLASRGGTLELTAKSEGDKRFLMRANGILDIVPLAKKEMGEVREVRKNPDGTAAALFTWRWLPNEVGSALKSGPAAERFEGEQTSTATLIWDGSSWSVLEIER
jgi:hypothetical protein